MIVEVDPEGPVPPYAQIQAQVATMVRSGVLPPGSRLPTIRHLANDLGVAVNTVARAFRELEADGLVVTRGRHGTFVTAPAAGRAAAPAAEADLPGLHEAARAFALDARHRGVPLDRALDAVRRAYRALEPDRRSA